MVDETRERPNEPSDEALALRVQAGDRDAFETLVRRYLRPLHGVAASLLAEEADVEDAVQDAFLRTLDRIATYDPERPFGPWLYQIARNVARNRWTQSQRRRTEMLPEWGLEALAPDPEAALDRAETGRLLEREIERLPEQRRTAFRLIDVEGYEVREVAGLMGLSAGTVRSHLHHARHALRRALRRVEAAPAAESEDDV